MIKLNLGSNSVRIPGFINVDLVKHPNVDVVANALKLPYKDGEVDEILASHLIEHFDYIEGQQALKEWYRVLKKGGKITIECPDFLAFCRNFINLPEDERSNYYVQVWGYPWEPGQAHKFGYTLNQLIGTLKSIGFKDIKQLPALRYSNLVNWCMKFEATK